MGNCIGKKSHTRLRNRRQPSSITPSSQFNSVTHRSTTVTSSDRQSTRISDFPDERNSRIRFSTNEKKLVQYSSSLNLTDEQFVFTNTLIASSPIQLSIQSTIPSANDKLLDIGENNVVHPIKLITDEQDAAMGNLLNREKETNNNKDLLIFPQETNSEPVDISPSLTFSDSSLSSFSCNTTSFSSQDQLLFSSSYSSSDNNSNLLTYQLNNHHNRFSNTEQISSHSQSSHEIFSTILPTSFSRWKNDLFFSEFHHNIESHCCKTLSSVIGEVLQQEFIRIHRRTKTVFIEHKQLECINLKDLNNLDTPSLIFDEEKKLIYITKYSRWNELDSISYRTKDVSTVLSSCGACSLLLSGSKLNNCLNAFLLVNTTYSLVQMYFNEMNNNNIFGYVSQIDSNTIRQIIINNSKLNYSCDLDVDHVLFYFVLHIKSWPQEMRSNYEKRQRLWPLNIDQLFNNTCFVRFDSNEQEIFTNDKCLHCEKNLFILSKSSWSYTYAAIEAQLVLLMTDGHIRFASMLWNYLNSKTQGQLPFMIFKHTLFYFFEQYPSNSFTTSDLVSHVNLFINSLIKCFERKSISHYFNSNYNLYNDNLPYSLIDLLSDKITYVDIKHSSIYLLPKSSLYLYHLIYLIQFQSSFLQYLRSPKTNLIQTIIDTHESVIQQFSFGIKTYKQQLDSNEAIKSCRPLTLDILYRYQEQNVQVILDYLPLLREKEPSLIIHSLWSIFIQYFNSLFDDLFIS